MLIFNWSWCECSSNAKMHAHVHDMVWSLFIYSLFLVRDKLLAIVSSEFLLAMLSLLFFQESLSFNFKFISISFKLPLFFKFILEFLFDPYLDCLALGKFRTSISWCFLFRVMQQFSHPLDLCHIIQDFKDQCKHLERNHYNNQFKNASCIVMQRLSKIRFDNLEFLFQEYDNR